MTILQSEPHPTAEHAWLDAVLRGRILLTLGTLACMLLFWAAARQFGIPAAPGHSGSLLQQPNVGVAVVLTALVFVAAVFVGTTFTARVHRDAGLFCACLGLAVLSGRAGAMRYVLFEASGRSVYLMLAGETLLLGALLAAAWIGIDRFLGPSRSSPLTDSPGNSPGDAKYFTTIMQVLLMIALMSVLAQTDSKAQAMAAVGASALLASLAANWFAAASPSPWLWAGPIIVALVGYISCYFHPAGMEVGRTSGYFAALARPLPLDYASVGVAGSLLGYWTSTRWHQRAGAGGAATTTQEKNV
jgi:hypothetical protein